jgi:dTDP-4-amino-4,6-dideoxygalactose transaminase
MIGFDEGLSSGKRALPHPHVVPGKRIDDLAVFGGLPAFDRKLHVGQPNLGDRAYFMQRVAQVLDSKWYTNHGECVQELEAKLCDYLGVKHCVAVCNATVGLEIAIRAMPMQGEVIVPSMTFVATAHALQWQQIKPVFCDVDETSHVLDPGEVRRLITPRTTGILGVHLWGHACPVEELQDIADEHGLHLMFDAAHAFGCTHGGRMIGGFGRAEVFSFHATKFFNTFEGGAITTNDDELARRCRAMVNFGFTGVDDASEVGTNGKMHEVSAAMGLASLRSLDQFVAVNRLNHEAYHRHLARVPGMLLREWAPGERNNFQYVVVEYTPVADGPSRDELVAALWAENVMARKYFSPGCHRMEPYRTLDAGTPQRLERTEALADKLLILPTGTGVSVAEIEGICELLAIMVSAGPRLRSRNS